MKKSIILSLVVLVLTAVGVMGQARTAERLMDSTVSALDTGNPPNGSVRNVINGVPNTVPCQAAAPGAVTVGAFGMKMQGVWACFPRTIGAAAGDVTGPASSVDNEIALFSGVTGKVIKRASTTGMLKATAGVIGPAAATDLPTGIDATKIADGSVSNAEFQFINSLSSNAQSQIDGKQPLDADLTAIAGLAPSDDDVIQRIGGVWVNRSMVQVKAALVLNNVDNTSDVDKPISTATQTALDLKVPLASPTFTGTVTIPTPFTLGAVSVLPTGTELNFIDGVTSNIQTQLDGKQSLDSDLTAIAGLAPSNDDVIQRKAGVWVNRTMTQVKTDLALTKSDVGLNNVDDTSDAGKPISTATQTALDGKQPLDSDLTTIAGLTATTDNFIVGVASAWASRTPAQVKTTLGIAFTDISGSVTDAQVPNTITVDLATVATTANAGDSATAFFSAGTVEADRLPALSGLTGSVTDAQVPNNITVDLATLATTATTANAGDSATAFFSSGTIETARLGSGTADATTFLRGDSTWQAIAGGGTTINATDGVVPYRSNSTTFADSPLVRVDANTIEQRNSTTAQSLKVSKTFTDASNYERLSIGWDAAGYYEIRDEIAGTGVQRNMRLNSQGNLFLKGTAGFIQIQDAVAADIIHFDLANKALKWNTDNSGDIGASGASRPRTGYFGTSIAAPLATINSGALSAVGVTVGSSGGTAKVNLQQSSTSGSEGLGVFGFNYFLGASPGYADNRNDTAQIGLGLALDNRATNDGFNFFRVSAAGVSTYPYFFSGVGVLRQVAGGIHGWTSNTTDASVGSVDTGLARNAAGVVEVNNGTPGTLGRLVSKAGVTSITSNATWSPNADTDDMFIVTAQAAAVTTISNPTGTPTEGRKLMMRIKDNGTARALTWSGTQWRASTDLALPTTTIISKTLYLGFIWNATDSKWDLVALLNNF